MKRYRHHNRNRQHKLPLWGIIAICFGGALLVALIIGLILNATLDDESYYRLTTKPRNTQDETILFVPNVPDVVASAYRFGDDLADVSGKSAVSLVLNSTEGRCLYHSDVLAHFKSETSGSEELSTTLALLAGERLYVSGIFYLTALQESEPTLRYAVEAEEIALIKEFFYLGGNDLILCGSDLFDNLEKSIAYLKSIKLAVGEKAIGIVLPYERLLESNAGTTLEKLLTACDFIALDLRGVNSDKPLDEVLAATKYSYKQYHLRLLFSQKQTAWIESAREMGIMNYEILK